MADLSLSRNTPQGTACVGDQSFVSTWSKDALVLGAYIYIYMVNVCLTAFISSNICSISCNLIVFTSSTAQGEGGSFKHRKPIGEISCCESGMAERIHWWTERCLMSPLFLSLSDYLPTYQPIYLSIDLSIYLSICRPVYLWCSVIQCNVV